jgi:uncharacterized protein DUF4255
MSNGLAIAAVTSTLRYVLERALQHPHPGPVDGARVSTRHPHQLIEAGVAPEPLLNVFLYQVTNNQTWRPADLPSREENGANSRPPVAALDLHYLISCHGQDESLDAQRLLGRAVIALATTPVLTPDVVTAAVTTYETAPETTFLGESDLAGQVDLVKLSPTILSMEEMSNLWSILLQTPYILSLTYVATVVLIQPDVTA